MIILGIDPAIRTTGYGVIRADNPASFTILDCGVIANSARLPHTECLRRLAGGIRELIDSFHPDCASIEEPFLGKNASTAIILGMARGAILTALAERQIPVYAYSPRSAKRSAVGNGGATKEQVARIMAVELGIEIEQIPLVSTLSNTLADWLAQPALPPALAENMGLPL